LLIYRGVPASGGRSDWLLRVMIFLQTGWNVGGFPYDGSNAQALLLSENTPPNDGALNPAKREKHPPKM
jgi:hypothetical protein